MFLIFHIWLPLEVIILHRDRVIFCSGWEGVIKTVSLKKEKRSWPNAPSICSVGFALTLQTAFVSLGLEFKVDLNMVLFARFLVINIQEDNGPGPIDTETCN